MKREAKDEYPKIKKIKPRFARVKCDICGQEFKNENMWEAWYQSLVSIGGTTAFRKYGCMNCCPTSEIMMQKTMPKARPPKK